MLPGFIAANAYWEAKLLIPGAGSERWPVFWVIGSTANGINYQFGEVDISEFTASEENLHLWTVVNGVSTDNLVGHFTPPALSAGWHVFGCLIQPVGTTTTVSIYIDGALSQQFSGLSSAFSTPDEVILSNGFGPGEPATGNSGWTNDLGVQYVRCWAP